MATKLWHRPGRVDRADTSDRDRDADRLIDDPKRYFEDIERKADEIARREFEAERSSW